MMLGHKINISWPFVKSPLVELMYTLSLINYTIYYYIVFTLYYSAFSLGPKGKDDSKKVKESKKDKTEKSVRN